MRKYVVRVILPKQEKNDSATQLLEQLRYAQVVRIHRDDEIAVCFDIVAPHGLDTERWAKMNSERMTSFGYNAVAAPSTV